MPPSPSARPAAPGGGQPVMMARDIRLPAPCSPYRPRPLPAFAAGVLVIVLLLLAAASGYATDNTGLEAIMASRASQEYRAARDYFYRLERDRRESGKRQNWLNGIRNFRKIYLALPEGKLAPSCLYMIARMYRQMYDRFHHPLDLEEATRSFGELARRFPGNELADDALFATAEIYLHEKKDPARAATFYSDIVKRYRKGDKYAQAASRLRELGRTADVTVSGQLVARAAPEQLVHVLPVRYWSSDDYTRIVIRTTAPVHYSTRLLEKNGSLPRRLLVDLHQSYIPPKFRAPIPIEDGLLRQVRSGQFNDNTVQVVLDIESISDYKIFSLNDPFRVIIDVHGRKKQKPAAREQVTAAKPPPPPVRVQPGAVKEKVSRPAAGSGAPAVVILRERKKKRVAAAASPAATVPATGPDSISLAQQLGLGVRRIIIDPGHGGKDPGAMAFGLKEKDIVLKVARYTASMLRKKYGYEVIMTRDRDVFLPLEERTAIANTKKGDLFVSIHVNAHPKHSASGLETFYLNLATNTEAMRVAARENATSTHNISELQDILTDLMKNSKIRESSRLARYVQTNLVQGLERDNYRVKDLGVKQAPFYVLIGAEMPAVLAEISFITNPAEAKLLHRDSYLRDVARQIAAGIAAYVDHQRTAALRY
ncbi:MAG TPA: N-acetylmuramoyl-L-alanine amidase [Desulfobulbus sp.]|nr:N-acetylmuramoyl-L-alanine amidase [Desulfobulbus sp.]